MSESENNRLAESLQWMPEEFVPGLVSVIVPVYNREKLIHECVESIKAQTYRPIEILVVDDGSSDSTYQEMLSIRSECTDLPGVTIHCIQQPNSGAPSARNRGLRHSHGQYIQFLDSDDLLKPEVIKKKVDLISTSGYHYAYDVAEVTDKNGKTVGKCGGAWPEDGVNGTIINYLYDAAGPLFLRELIQNVGPWDENLRGCQEVEFFSRVKFLYGKGAFLDELGHIQRDHTGPKISGKTPGQGMKNHARSAFKVLENTVSMIRNTKYDNLTEWLSLSRFACDVADRCALASEPELAYDALKLGRDLSAGKRKLFLGVFVVIAKCCGKKIALNVFRQVRRSI